MQTSIVMKIDIPAAKVQQIVALGRWMHANHDGRAAQDVGIRAARAKDPEFMAYMEQFVITLDRMVEQEQGETRRTDRNWYRPEPAVQQIYRKTFEAAQDGRHPHLLNNFSCQLGAIAVAAGLAMRPLNAPNAYDIVR